MHTFHCKHLLLYKSFLQRPIMATHLLRCLRFFIALTIEYIAGVSNLAADIYRQTYIRTTNTSASMYSLTFRYHLHSRLDIHYFQAKVQRYYIYQWYIITHQTNLRCQPTTIPNLLFPNSEKCHQINSQVIYYTLCKGYLHKYLRTSVTCTYIISGKHL